jgi:hypothetical protein
MFDGEEGCYGLRIAVLGEGVDSSVRFVCDAFRRATATLIRAKLKRCWQDEAC